MATARELDPAREPAAQDVREAYREVQLALRRLRAREVGGTGATLARHSLLRQLAGGAELPASRLAAGADLSPPTVSRMLDDLEACGLVERRPDPDDRRVARARLTAAGEAQHAALEARLDEAWRRALGDLSPGELAAGVRVLGRIRDALDGL